MRITKLAAVTMTNAKEEGRVFSNTAKMVSQRLLPPRMLLVSSIVILFSIGPAAVNGKCLAAFAFRDVRKLSALPPNSSVTSVKSVMECVATCNRDAACQQLLYFSMNGTCFVIRSPELKNLPWNASDRWLWSSPSDSSEYVVAFVAANTCPVPSACVSDCSSSPDSSCSADDVQHDGDPQVVQIRHYYFNAYNDPSDEGTVQVVTFCKLRSGTALRVQWRALIRTQLMSNDSCGRYYVTFNGAECSQPNTIDISGSDQTANNEHRTFELDGICYAVPAGNISIAINVGPCPGYKMSDSHTGANFSINTWIWELWPSSTSCGLQCDAMTIDNIQYQASSDEFSVYPDAALTTMIYDKRANDTLLKVTWLAPTRVNMQTDETYCFKWFVTVNGSNCNPKAEYAILFSNFGYNYMRANAKTRTLEGYCNGLKAGVYAITVRVGNCSVNSAKQPVTTTGGSSSVSRFIVSEVRASTQKQIVQTYFGNVVKTPFFNLRQWSWASITSGNQTGTLVSVMYNKMSNSSGLHVRFLAVMRTTYYCRWYVTINDCECSSPGPIESGTIISQAIYYHHQGVVDGVCFGYNSGNYSISVKVTGKNAGDCYTGAYATLQLIVQETQLTSAVICQSPKVCV